VAGLIGGNPVVDWPDFVAGAFRVIRKHGKAGLLPRSILSGDHRQHFSTW
jgi:hypothetical protein